jgi:hypothetical protein
MNYRDPHKEPETVTETLRYVWRWFRARHRLIQIIAWVLFWWALVLLYIWQTRWTRGRKLALRAPIVLFVLSVYVS